jgi:hypothetical protein
VGSSPRAAHLPFLGSESDASGSRFGYMIIQSALVREIYSRNVLSAVGSLQVPCLKVSTSLFLRLSGSVTAHRLSSVWIKLQRLVVRWVVFARRGAVSRPFLFALRKVFPVFFEPFLGICMDFAETAPG